MRLPSGATATVGVMSLTQRSAGSGVVTVSRETGGAAGAAGLSCHQTALVSAHTTIVGNHSERCGRDGLYFGAEIADGLPTLPGTLLEAAFQQPAEAWIESRRERCEVGLPDEHRCEDGRRAVTLKGRPTSQKLVEHAPEREDVAAMISRFTFGLLGRHVGRGTENHSRLRRHQAERRRLRDCHPITLVGTIVVGVFDQLGQPEIEHLHGAVVANLDVGGLEIAMDDPLLVRSLERLGDLPGDGQRLIDGNRAVGESIGQRRPFHQLTKGAALDIPVKRVRPLEGSALG
jgi:hypothetical protein